MDSFHYKTYVHILFSEKKIFILIIFRRSFFILIASFQEAIPPTNFPYAK